MPTVRTKRTDILRQKEILETIDQAEQEWLKALVALAWVFGKRINELLRLSSDDIWIEGNYLYIRFFVSKKKHRKDQATPKPFVKRINLIHKAVPVILYYWRKTPGPLFPYSRYQAHYYLKKANPKAWFHLFRESLATEMAEHGATEEQLLHWFDWDRVDTAHEYVKRGTKLTEALSERTW